MINPSRHTNTYTRVVILANDYPNYANLNIDDIAIEIPLCEV